MLHFNMRLRIVVTLMSLATIIPASAQGKLEASRDLDLQVRLARMNASPGSIDSKMGKNMQFAIGAFQRMRGLIEFIFMLDRNGRFGGGNQRTRIASAELLGILEAKCTRLLERSRG